MWIVVVLFFCDIKVVVVLEITPTTKKESR